jgi:hypothetical protein
MDALFVGMIPTSILYSLSIKCMGEEEEEGKCWNYELV